MADTSAGSTLDFARERLFRPIGIATEDVVEPAIAGPSSTAEQLQQYAEAPVAWPRDPQGYHEGAGFLKLPARDLARFGYLYLNQGRWDDEQVVPAEYVRASTSAQVETVDGAADHGWHWWVPAQRRAPSSRAVTAGS